MYLTWTKKNTQNKKYYQTDNNNNSKSGGSVLQPAYASKNRKQNVENKYTYAKPNKISIHETENQITNLIKRTKFMQNKNNLWKNINKNCINHEGYYLD